jgi:alanyl-tRNA synthetase
MKSGVIVLGAEADSKVMLICGVTKDLTDRFHAGKIVKELSAKVGGKGGGRADMAQGGGPEVEKLTESLENVVELLRSSDEKG